MRQMSQADYFPLLELISTETENAFVIFHTYEALNRLALDGADIFRVLNNDALFWQTCRSTLLTSLFMTMSRLFDQATDAITVQRFVAATIANPQMFSKDALRARKVAVGPEPAWLGNYMSTVWEPQTSADLRHLKRALNPHVTLFQSVYMPIRDNVYAHRFMTDERAGQELFPKTNRQELRDTLSFIRDLHITIRHLYDHGVEPVLGRQDSTYESNEIEAGVEKVLRKLVKRSD
jgi:HEPN superfamily AbiU2-like protein